MNAFAIIAAASEALMEARENPGCLVRVTFDHLEDVCFTIETLTNAAATLKMEPRANVTGPWPILELNNGSGIELALAEAIPVRKPGTHSS